MGPPSSQASFVFISSTTGSVPGDPDTRKVIRSQASREAHSRRKQGWRGKRGGRQNRNRFIMYNGPGPLVKGGGKKRRREENQDTTISLSAPLSQSYEKMRIQYNFDLLDLSNLTSYHTTYTTVSALRQRPARLVDVLCTRRSSYLDYIPSLYGSSQSLDTAVHCLAAQLQHFLHSPTELVTPTPNTLGLYSDALKMLQLELNDPEQYSQPHVLCATEILGLYELLNGTTQSGWIQHVSGAASLIQLRSVDRYKSDFEKDLLLSQIGSIFNFCIYNQQQCFLAEERWQSVLRSIAKEEDGFSERSELSITLWSHACKLPGLFVRVSKAVSDRENVSPSILVAAKDDLLRLHDSLSKWRELYAYRCSSEKDTQLPDSPGGADRLKLLGLSLSMLITVDRLIVAIAPSSKDAMAYENEANHLATQMPLIERKAISTNAGSDLFIGMKTHVANSVLATTSFWKHCIRKMSKSENTARPISKDAFRMWYGSLSVVVNSLRE